MFFLPESTYEFRYVCMACLGKETMAILWEEWLASNENWKQSKYALRLQRSHSHEKMGCRRWMTFKQIVAKYEDEGVAKAIVAGKKEDPLYQHDHVKPHPDCPSDPATRLHWAYASRGTELLMIRWFKSRRVDISTSQSAFVWDQFLLTTKIN